MRWPERVSIIEVGPRDGLQNVARFIETADKVELVHRLVRTGLKKIEVTSFVRPAVIPQHRDAMEVMAALERFPGVVYRALVPNVVGVQRAIAARVDEVMALITMSPSYNLRNQNMTIEQSLKQVEAIYAAASEAGIPVTVALGMPFYCPYEGDIPQERVLMMAQRFYDLGVRSMYLGAASGLEHPRQVYELSARLVDRFPDVTWALHAHNSNGLATANALAAMQAGILTFETAICGLGAGRMIPRDLEAGNLPTEDFLQMMNEMGIETGVDFDAYLDVVSWLTTSLGLPGKSFVAQGGTKRNAEALARTRPEEHPA